MKHGTNSCYIGGCRCALCKKAHAVYQYQHRTGITKEKPVSAKARLYQAAAIIESVADGDEELLAMVVILRTREGR